MPITDPLHPPQRLCVQAAGRNWTLERPADLESLWQSMDEDDPEAEEHIPYWVELWPATLALCGWLAKQDLAGRRCLDLGCGLGLSALVASNLGAQVAGMDYERDALYFAARNARLNAVPDPLWLCMDWNRPGFASACFERIWGGDIFYEQRFRAPGKPAPALPGSGRQGLVRRSRADSIRKRVGQIFPSGLEGHSPGPGSGPF